MTRAPETSPPRIRTQACVDGAGLEPLAGTAPHRPVWALVEHPGPWGREAVLDAAWDVPGERLQSAFDAAGVRVVLARRHGREGRRAGQDDGTRVILARCGPGGWAARATVDGAAGLLGLDWAAALAGSPDGGIPAGWVDAGHVWAICTHGTRDACCARLGRPLAAAFDAEDPDGTWEISHSGGHRFAGVAIAFPEGLVYGRVSPHDAAVLHEARARSEVVPHLLRGAVHLGPQQQAAQAALRDHLGEPGLQALTPLDGPEGLSRAGLSRWRHDPQTGPSTRWQVEVTERPLADRPASCGKRSEPATAWVATSVSREA